MAGNFPYIGSKISLITTSDIRYEGILYTLNREESTIAVQNVRSFGTEGRRVPEVPMSNEIYDFIIFRGKDLKDLTVLQGTPEQRPPPSAFDYPDQGQYGSQQASTAYQTASSLHSGSAAGRQGASASGAVGLSSGAPALSGSAFSRPAGLTSVAQAAAPPRTNGGYSPTAGVSAGLSPTIPPSASANSYIVGAGYGSSPAAGSRLVPSEKLASPFGARSAVASSASIRQTFLSSEPATPPDYQASRAPGLYEESNGNGALSRDISSDDKGKGGPIGLGSSSLTISQDRMSDKDQKAGGDARGAGRGKGGAQKKQLFEVLRFHKRAEETIVKTMRSGGSANLGPMELRALSETNPSVYHFYLDFVNYCCPSHMVQTDEQQWEMLCKALKKHFEKEFGANQSQKVPQVQRPNNTLGDFITITTDNKAAKKNAKITSRGVGPIGGAPSSGTGSRGGGKGGKTKDGEADESPAQSSSWVCARCTLRNENFLLECAACGTSKQQAALWAEFPPLG